MNRFGDIDCSFKQLPPVYGYHSEELVSIEKALEPIGFLINELPRYIKIAKKFCHFPSEHGLTRDQSAAVYIYTMEWGNSTLHRILNEALRSENRQELKLWFPYLKLFDTALDKLPTVKEGVWCGTPYDIAKNFIKNQTVTWWSFNSCSLSADVIKKFLETEKNSTVFLIEAVNGKNISGYTEQENEKEIILRMNSQFRVKNDPLRQSNDSHFVQLIEIDDDDVDRDNVDHDRVNYGKIDHNNINDGKVDHNNINDGKVDHGRVNYGKVDHNNASENNDRQDADDDEPLASTMSQASAPENSSKTSATVVINIPLNGRWASNGVTIAGGNEKGRKMNQLKHPYGLYIADDKTIYIADHGNHRITQWNSNATSGKVVAGGNGHGNHMHQLDSPTDVIHDKETNSLIICDGGNRRVVRWSLENDTTKGEIVFENIACRGLVMDDQRCLYVSDFEKHEVKRYKIGEKNGVLVAGGNGRGDHLNQFNGPFCLFVDREYSVYVSDYNNQRVMKWMKDETEGIVVVGSQLQENSVKQLLYPRGVFVDMLGTVYVVEEYNQRVTRWYKEATQGDVIVGGNGKGDLANQLYYPKGLSFDQDGHLYVIDYANHRVQRFFNTTS